MLHEDMMAFPAIARDCGIISLQTSGVACHLHFPNKIPLFQLIIPSSIFMDFIGLGGKGAVLLYYYFISFIFLFTNKFLF